MEEVDPALKPGPFHFTDMTAESGIDFVHESGDFEEKPFPAANGSGLAAFDFDLDGWVDLYFLTGSRATFDPNWTAHPRNRAYRNLGDWKFRALPPQAGLECQRFSAGVAIGDFDGDGFPDVFVNCYGSDLLFRNQGDGTFDDVSELAGFARDTQWGTSAAFLDYDNDGLLDLYVANYALWNMELNQYCGDRGRGVRTFCGPTTVEPAPHAMYHNEGDGTYRQTTEEIGLGGSRGRGQGVLAADLNQDGHVDLYVANDMNPNFLFVNDGQGRFRDDSQVSGADVDYRGAAQAGMGLALADGNRDGRFELFVTNYEGEHNAYYENLGGLLFQDVSRSRGLAADSIPWVGWGTVLADFDLDGWPDCLVTNGHTDNNFEAMGRDSPYAQPPGAWHNKSGRYTFVGGAGMGEYFGNRHVGRGLATADLDRDGDLDVVIGHQDGPPAVLRNDRVEQWGPESGVRLRLVGRSGNREALGAVVRRLGAKPAQVQAIVGGGSYESASEPMVRMVPTKQGETLELEIHWPGGRTSLVNVAGPADVVVREPDGP